MSLGDQVDKLRVRSDGKVVVARSRFGESSPQHLLLRLNPDGSLDPTFTAPQFTAHEAAASPVATAMELQGDKILVAGTFGTVNGVPVNGFVRINADGSLDPTFRQMNAFAPVSAPWEAAVVTIEVQSNGGLVLGGNFREVNGTPRTFLARLHSDGTHDPSFGNPFQLSAGNPFVVSIHEDANRSLWVAGSMEAPTGDGVRSILVRLNEDGTLDPSIDLSGGQPFWGAATAMTVDLEGRVLMAGEVARHKALSRLLPTGVLDPAFDIGSGPDGRIFALAVQSDGSVLAVGEFRTWSGVPRHHIARLLPSGTLDPTFDPGEGPGYWVWDMDLQPPDRVVVGGLFRSVGAYQVPGLAALFIQSPGVSRPTILEEPLPVDIEAGDNIRLSAEVGGNPWSGQWFRDGVIVNGAFQNTLTVLYAQQQHAGAYHLRVSNLLGVAQTRDVTVRVRPAESGTNMIVDPSFEAFVHSMVTLPPPPKVDGWQMTASVFGLWYPGLAPLNPLGFQMPLNGTNYVGAGYAYFGESPFEGNSAVGELRGRLVRALVPGQRYSFSVAYSPAESSLGPPAGVEARLVADDGRELWLGGESTTDFTEWSVMRRTFVPSAPYRFVVLRPAVGGRPVNQQGLVFMDKTALRPVASTAPVLAAQPIQSVAPWDLVVVTNRVTETDVTDQSLVYTLANSAPRGAILHPNLGILTWTPGTSLAGTTQEVEITAQYRGSSASPGTTRVRVEVAEGLDLTVGRAWARSGGRAELPVTLTVHAQEGVGISNLVFEVEIPTNHSPNAVFLAGDPSVATAVVAIPEPNRLRLQISAKASLRWTGTTRLGVLALDVGASVASGEITLPSAVRRAEKPDGTEIRWARSDPLRIGVVNQQALLVAGRSTNGPRLALYGIPGRRYRLERTPTLSVNAAWVPVQELEVDQFPQEVTGALIMEPMSFLRAVEIP
ncbi:MAG: hypothetical protein JNK85_17860 [Verrucomicrobiales bacterium]|nr:hypothetical protein [Verrucomicrobiales bacterium]